MEVKIGIQNVNREIILDSSESADAIAELVAAAMSGGTELRLKDSKGRQVIVPTSVLGYVEIGAEETRRVGFGAL
ncbi:ATP-binding protein [Arthrobacter sp. MN05-02]|nr:ATP-binding protein [Arthrobacter sp. MN05-02]